MPKINQKGRRPLLSAFLPLIILLIISLALCSYSDVWPPLAAIDSGSMQHSDDQSGLGVLDAGDIVLIKKVRSLSEINTYLDGLSAGSESYAEHGDVIIYLEEGMPRPIIHRAICNLQYNTTGGGFDLPSLSKVPKSLWYASGEGSWWNLKGMLSLFRVGYAAVTVNINLTEILQKMGNDPHGGLITMGDANWVTTPFGKIGQYGQSWLRNGEEPIILESVVGVAKGEVPWLGGLKVAISEGSLRSVPVNSQVAMISVFALLISFPFVPELSRVLRKR